MYNKINQVKKELYDKIRRSKKHRIFTRIGNSYYYVDLTGEYLELAKMIGAEMHTKRRKPIGLNLGSTSCLQASVRQG